MKLIRRLIGLDAATLFLMAAVLFAALGLLIFRKQIFCRMSKRASLIFRITVSALLAAFCMIFGATNFVHGWARFFWNRFTLFFVCCTILILWLFIRPLFRSKKIFRRIFGTLTALAFTVCYGLGIYNVSGIASGLHFVNQSAKGWADGFSALIDDMEKSYPLKDWKKIDFDFLRKKYIPLVQVAEENGDDFAFKKVLMEYKYEFHDGHVYVDWITKSDDDFYSFRKKILGNDFGLSMFGSDDGKVYAVCCEKSGAVFEAGITDGTEIVSWNGKPILQAVEQVQPFDLWTTCEVLQNENYIRPLLVPCGAEESATVQFVDKNGIVQTATLHAIGLYADRYESVLNLFYGYGKAEQENLSARMLDDKTGLLTINIEQYDEAHDVASYITGRYPFIEKLVKERLESLQAQGMERLILDLRNNIGGYLEFSMAVASLFTDQPLMMSDGIYRNKKYIPLCRHKCDKIGSYSTLPVIVLVNDNCISAGDMLVYLLSKGTNVKVAGITSSSGSAQETGGYCLLTNSDYLFGYPVLSFLDENNLPAADVDETRTRRIPLDIHIPLDKDAVVKLFSEDVDYEMEYVAAYLKDLQL